MALPPIETDLDTTQYSPIELLAMEFDYLVTSVDSCADLGDDALLFRAQYELKAFMENYAPEMPQILEIWDNNK